MLTVLRKLVKHRTMTHQGHGLPAHCACGLTVVTDCGGKTFLIIQEVELMSCPGKWLLPSSMVAKYAELKLYLKHSKSAVLVENTALVTYSPGHGFPSLVVLRLFFGGECQPTKMKMLVRKLQQVLGSAKEHRVK